MKTKVNYLRKHNDVNTYSQTISVICSEKEFMDMAQVVKSYIKSGNTYACCAKPITVGTNFLTINTLHKLAFNFWENNKCDWHGTPLYPVETGYYFLQKDKNQAKEYLRVTDEEMGILSKCDNKEYFKYQLFALGIVERWQAESKKAIQTLEELTGDVWVNPYKESEERHRFVLSDEEREEMEGKILSGYYTESAIQERKEAERIAKIEKRKNEVIKTFEKIINKATKEKDVKLAILGAGLLSDNYIYYVEGNNVVFNYYSYHDKVTEEEYNNMLMPEGIKFEFK